MKKLVTITHIGEMKEGVSQKTGNKWYLTDIDVEWTVEQPGTESYQQSCVGTVSGIINMDALGEVMKIKRPILVTMYVGVRIWQGRHFTNVDIKLPKEYLLDEKPL